MSADTTVTANSRRTLIDVRALSLVAGLGMAACDGGARAVMPTGAVPFQPSIAYSAWWALTESCSGQTAELRDITWYVVPGTHKLRIAGGTYDGYWWPDRIVLAESAMMNGRLVRHEMLHAILGKAEHRREAFIEHCGGIVVCDGECARDIGDIGATAPADAPRLQPSDLSVSVRVDPAFASVSQDSGWIAISVTATNPNPYAVWVRLRPVAEGERSSATFGYFVESAVAARDVVADEYTFIAADSLAFAAGQSRRWTFDRQILAGEYSVRGFFNTDTTSSAALSVRP